MKRQQNSSTRRNPTSSHVFPVTVGVLCALILAAVFAWVLWHKSSSTGRRSTFAESFQEATHPHGDQHKPSAGKPASVPQAPSQQTAPESSPVAPNTAPPQTPSLSPTAAATPVASSGPAEHTYRAERKGIRNGCKSGELSLSPTSLTFTCSDDTSRNVSLTMAEVRGQDDDGVESIRHEKYHFKIEGRSKDATRLLFTEWLSASQSNPPAN